MNKIILKINVEKIEKTKINTRSYKNKNNDTVSFKELSLEAIPLKEPKLIKEGGTWNLYKTHFVVQEQTPEERNMNTKSEILGDGLTFMDKESLPEINMDNNVIEIAGNDNVSSDDFPF